MFAPAGRSRRCAVLLLHGGGWRSGSRVMVHTRARALAEHGFIALAVQYRLRDEAPWPAPLADIGAALRWVRDNSGQLGIDPGQVVVQGHSAGGHIALMSGTLEADVRPAAIAAYYPAVGFYPAAPPADGLRLLPPDPDGYGRVPSWMLFPPGTDSSELDLASPLELITPQFPPTVLFHGTADTVIAVRSSIGFHQRLLEHDVSTELHVHADRDHEFDQASAMLAATTRATAYFVERTVLRREEAQAEARRFAFPSVAASS